MSQILKAIFKKKKPITHFPSWRWEIESDSSKNVFKFLQLILRCDILALFCLDAHSRWDVKACHWQAGAVVNLKCLTSCREQIHVALCGPSRNMWWRTLLASIREELKVFGTKRRLRERTLKLCEVADRIKSRRSSLCTLSGSPFQFLNRCCIEFWAVLFFVI